MESEKDAFYILFLFPPDILAKTWMNLLYHLEILLAFHVLVDSFENGWMVVCSAAWLLNDDFFHIFSEEWETQVVFGTFLSISSFDIIQDSN